MYTPKVHTGVAPLPSQTVSEKGTRKLAHALGPGTRGCGPSSRPVHLTGKFRLAGGGVRSQKPQTALASPENATPPPARPPAEPRTDSCPRGRRPSGLSAGLARAPRPLEQSFEARRNFPESRRRGGAGPAARAAPAAAGPQLPERQ